MSREGDFLSRWARRKAEAREAESASAETEAALSSVEGSAGAQSAEQAPDDRNRPATEDEIAALPDPDSLEHGADFKPFLRPGIPAALRQRALRRLWRVNPAIGFLDGMNEYDLDYTDAATVVDNLKTAWQLGKGFVTGDEQEKAVETRKADRAKEAGAAEGAGPATKPPTESSVGAEVPASDVDEADVDDFASLARDGTAEQAADDFYGSGDEPPEPKKQTADAGASIASNVGGASSPPPEPGQAAARRWARFSTAEKR